MNKWVFTIFIFFVFSCKEKQLDLSGEVPIKQNDFFGIFKPMTLPFNVSDTNIEKSSDTITIGLKAFLQFFPDSAFKTLTGNNRNLIIHPIGKIEKENEQYFIILITEKKKKQLAVFITTKKNKFLGSKELLNNDHQDEYFHSLLINKEPTFLLSKEKMGKDGQLLFSRTGWVYSDLGIFMVVINDSNEDPKKLEVINPIDTLAKKNKYSGDYIKDKKNYVSIRDGKNANSYQFFIHFERNEGSCTGELKGELKMKTNNTGIFNENGDPCIIDFAFEGNEISIKEQGTCGNHRGIKCFFNDQFIKKKETKSKKIKKLK
jgi:hypothetical protein